MNKVFIPFTTFTTHVRSHFPCYDLKYSSGDKESLPSHVLVSCRMVFLLYPTYYIVKVDPFPKFGDEYVNIMIKMVLKKKQFKNNDFQTMHIIF